jgi:hypothetical protein
MVNLPGAIISIPKNYRISVVVAVRLKMIVSVETVLTGLLYGPEVQDAHAADALAVCVSNSSIVNSTPVIRGFSAR